MISHRITTRLICDLLDLNLANAQLLLRDEFE